MLGAKFLQLVASIRTGNQLSIIPPVTGIDWHYCGVKPDVGRWGFPEIFNFGLHSEMQPFVVARERAKASDLARNPRALIGFHRRQLPPHDALLAKEKDSSADSGTHGGYVKPEPAALSLFSAPLVGVLLCGVALGLIVYSLYRGDYLLPVGVFLAFIPAALGLSLLLDGTCPLFFVSLYSALPICRYVGMP